MSAARLKQVSDSVYRWGSDNQYGAYIVGTDAIAVIDGHYCPSGTMQWLKEELKERHDVSGEVRHPESRPPGPYLQLRHVLDYMVEGRSLAEIRDLVVLEEFSDYGGYDRWLDQNIVTMWDYLYRYREPNQRITEDEGRIVPRRSDALSNGRPEGVESAVMHRKEHWEHVYESKSPDRLGWYKPQLHTPLEWIRELCLPSDAGHYRCRFAVRRHWSTTCWMMAANRSRCSIFRKQH